MNDVPAKEVHSQEPLDCLTRDLANGLEVRAGDGIERAKWSPADFGFGRMVQFDLNLPFGSVRRESADRFTKRQRLVKNSPGAPGVHDEEVVFFRDLNGDKQGIAVSSKRQIAPGPDRQESPVQAHRPRRF